eukprot:2510033-Rhodomonas_salina.3
MGGFCTTAARLIDGPQPKENFKHQTLHHESARKVRMNSASRYISAAKEMGEASLAGIWMASDRPDPFGGERVCHLVGQAALDFTENVVCARDSADPGPTPYDSQAALGSARGGPRSARGPGPGRAASFKNVDRCIPLPHCCCGNASQR